MRETRARYSTQLSELRSGASRRAGANPESPLIVDLPMFGLDGPRGPHVALALDHDGPIAPSRLDAQATPLKASAGDRRVELGLERARNFNPLSRVSTASSTVFKYMSVFGRGRGIRPSVIPGSRPAESRRRSRASRNTEHFEGRSTFKSRPSPDAMRA